MEGLGIWRYFPASAEKSGPVYQHSLSDLFVPSPDGSFDSDTLQVDEFQSGASEDEKQQYERFVVVKEACGNLFVAALFGPGVVVLRAQKSEGTRFTRRFLERWRAFSHEGPRAGIPSLRVSRSPSDAFAAPLPTT